MMLLAVTDLWPLQVQLPAQMPPLSSVVPALTHTQIDPLLIILGMSWFIILVMALIQWRTIVAFTDVVKLMLSAGVSPQSVPKPIVIPPAPLPAPAATPASVPVPAPAPSPVPAPPPPVPHPLVDDALVEFTSKQEGFSARAYWDYKQYTIGYGTRANSSTEVITEAEARKRLLAELNDCAKSVEAFIPDAPRGVKQAMIDATFNLGTGWQSQSLGKALKAGNYTTAAADLLQYNHAGGQVLPALTKRRQAEVSWFQNPI